MLSHSQDFKLGSGYYSEEMIFLCLAFLSLLRVKNINQANTIPCGELGRAMGLDRIPKVKTLRQRIARFTAKGNVQQWSEKLSQGWMSANTGLAGVLHIDGHVNVYYGHATTMQHKKQKDIAIFQGWQTYKDLSKYGRCRTCYRYPLPNNRNHSAAGKGKTAGGFIWKWQTA